MIAMMPIASTLLITNKEKIEMGHPFFFHYPNKTKMTPIPGALYNFKCDKFWGDPTIIRQGIFVKQNEYPGSPVKYWVFQLSRSIQVSLNSRYVTYTMDTSPTVAKHVARGLCTSKRIPEDCAGIIERMLVGDTIVGKGPDRYEER